LVAPGIVHETVVMPSQSPLHPVPSPGHALRGATGAPVTGEQVPLLVARLHASHWPVQSLLQHTPSAQNPVVHCALEEHDPPGPIFASHWPLAQ
jgi:hypothetical protein